MTRVIFEQKNYVDVLEKRIKDKDAIYLEVVADNRVVLSHQKLKAELSVLQQWSGNNRDIGSPSRGVLVVKNLKKTTSAKIFKGSELDNSKNG